MVCWASRVRLAGTVLALVSLTGCSDSEDPAAAPAASGGSASGGAPSASCDANGGRFAITDDTNYSIPSSLAVEMTTLKDATDLTFDWSGLTRDFLGRPMNAAIDVDLVLVTLWSMTPEELRQNLERDDLPLNTNIGAITTYPTDNTFTSQHLLGFDLLGNPVPEEELWAFFDTQDPNFEYPQDQYTFMLMASTGTTLGKNVRMLSMFNLDPNSTTTDLSLHDASTNLDFTVNMAGARHVRVPAATPALTIDWSQMTTNALGNEFVGLQVTEAVVAHFPTSSVSELEAQFLELETVAQGWWTGEVAAGRTLDLGTLLDENQQSFPGIDGEGVWLVALFCTASCNNPAPWSITILEPCE